MTAASGYHSFLLHRILAVLPFLYTPIALLRGDWSVFGAGVPFWLMAFAWGLLVFAPGVALRRVGAVMCILYALAGPIALCLWLALAWLATELRPGDSRKTVSVAPLLLLVAAFPVALAGIYGAVRVLISWGRPAAQGAELAATSPAGGDG